MTAQIQRKIKRMILDLEDLEEDMLGIEGETVENKDRIVFAIMHLRGIVNDN